MTRFSGVEFAVIVLDKWYFDLITPDGDVLIGYTARVHWRALRLSYQSIRFMPATGPSRERVSFRRSEPPLRAGNAIEWRSPALRTAGTWQGEAPPLRFELLHDEHARIRWFCHQPRARACVTLPSGRVVRGQGYVERLRLELRRALPFTTLHWGRFHSDSETLVWISWDHGAAGRWIFRNGERQPEAAVTNREITGLADGARLHFADLRLLQARGLPEAVARIRPTVAGLASMIGSMRERKWAGRGVLARADGTQAHGWLIHEEVSWAREVA